MSLQDYRYLDTNPAAFDCSNPNTNPSSFFGLEAVMIDPDCYEMSGTDCHVAYIFKDVDEVFKREIFGLKNVDDLLFSYNEYFALNASQLDTILASFHFSIRDAIPHCVIDYLFNRAIQGCVVLLTPQMRFNLKPYTQKGADALLNAMKACVERSEQYVMQHPEEAEFYYNRRLPALYEDLGRVCLNCSTLAKESA